MTEKEILEYCNLLGIGDNDDEFAYSPEERARRIALDIERQLRRYEFPDGVPDRA